MPLHPELEDAPAPTPSHLEEEPTPESWAIRSPLFSEATPPPPDMSSPPPLSSETPSEPLSLGPVDATSSDPRSTGSRRNRKRELLKVAAAVVETVAGMAHQMLTADGTPEREAGLYLADDDDVKAISDPLAGLASRRMPEGAENPDVADLARLVLGVVGYVFKQRTKAERIRRMWQPADDWPEGEAEQPEPAFPATHG